ncbi:hypothetical protein KPL42_11610 [Clostridium gasigenes]|uniref:DUF6241 domain-containing protein n=1 Tax=Clostridium gasigenes TaxID=94869 RepID=UPI001C0DD3A8|nr:DUF6241 domain-containing protein [Clostridium gasigenes]MBU3089132.1 hypothetical protein [Clostridium gasigenes]
MKNLKTVIISTILICALASGAVYITITNKIKKENELKIVQLKKEEDEKAAKDKIAAEAKAKEKAAGTQEDVFDTNIVSEERVYIRMHGMINTKINAEDGNTWGMIEITTEDCNKLIEVVNTNNYEDKEKLLAFLNSWKNKDFSNGVEQHNYIWEKLGGVEGKAISLK